MSTYAFGNYRPHCCYSLFPIKVRDLGSEESVIFELKSIERVTELQGIFGTYDVLAREESKPVETLYETITWKIRKIVKIGSL